jgi:hypothetical protein
LLQQKSGFADVERSLNTFILVAFTVTINFCALELQYQKEKKIVRIKVCAHDHDLVRIRATTIVRDSLRGGETRTEKALAEVLGPAVLERDAGCRYGLRDGARCGQRRKKRDAGVIQYTTACNALHIVPVNAGAQPNKKRGD